MGQHYLIDLFGNPVANARILDVQDPENFQTLLNGAFVIRVPSGVQVINPANVTDLLNQKYQGLLAENATFTRVTFDDLLDASHVDPTSGPGIFGQRGTITLQPGATFSSVINAGAGTPLTGATPIQALVTWEVFSITESDPASGQYQRTYTELTSDPTQATCQVSFNGGSTFNPTTDGTVINILGPDQGTAFIIQLTNVTQGRLYIGSWAVVY
jgi:hypothetical protein